MKSYLNSILNFDPLIGWTITVALFYLIKRIQYVVSGDHYRRLARNIKAHLSNKDSKVPPSTSA